MSDTKPRWSRRKEARPGEILDAAMDVFIEKGFAAAKVDEIARRAGLSKGALYVYFKTKDDIFRAVAEAALSSNLDALEAASGTFDGSLSELMPMFLTRVADVTHDGRVPAIARLVLNESQHFPDLARIWYDEVASRIVRLIADLVARAQARGEAREGDAQLYAYSIVGPMMAALLFREFFGQYEGRPLDLHALATQHANMVLQGLLVPKVRASKRA